MVEVTNIIGKNAQIFENVILGFPSRDKIGQEKFKGMSIGDNAIIRSGTIIYCNVSIGNKFQSGHNVVIRECTCIGDHVSIGTSTIIEGHSVLGNNINIQSMVYIPTGMIIMDGVFIGPNVVFTNDKYPPSDNLVAPIIQRNAAIGANSTLLPGVMIGEGALVAAGSVVTKNVPNNMMAIGSPAQIKPLPDEMINKRIK
jgi:acetyltransferase-like isoleucine patch superfamily enzyme